MSWFDDVTKMKEGDPCQFRFPARPEWRDGTVIHNGGPRFWIIRDDRTGERIEYLYAEHVRAPGGLDP